MGAPAAAPAVRGRAAARPRIAPVAGPESPLERIVHSLGGRWEWDGDLSYGRTGLNFSGTLKGTELT